MTDNPIFTPIDGAHVRIGDGLTALGRCALRTVGLLGRRELHQPADVVGSRVRWADGTISTVYRETVADHVAQRPCTLVVRFRLRGVHGPILHALFRLESELNTVLFAGFPGFVSKLWFANDERGVYRGLYEWDDSVAAEAYVKALWWALMVVSERSSIEAVVVPGVRRDELLRDLSAEPANALDAPNTWWRPTALS
jgi:hypothetical protein